jgi:hypothetical protein
MSVADVRPQNTCTTRNENNLVSDFTLFVSVCPPLHSLKQLTYFYKSLFEFYAIEGHTTAVLDDFQLFPTVCLNYMADARIYDAGITLGA